MNSLISIVFSLLLVGAAVARPLPDVIAQVRGSIVGVGTYEPSRRPPVKILGTGFAVSDGRHVVTNRHVLPKSINGERKEKLAIFSGRGKETKVHLISVLEVDAEHDLALLGLKDGKKLPALRLAGDKYLREGTSIAFTGFPIGMVLGLYPVTHRGIISAVTPVVIPAMSSRRLTPKMIKRMRNPYKVYQLDATAYPGNSGSPLYDAANGKVIGVINSVLVKSTKESALKDPSGITYAIPVRYVRRLLKRAKRIN